MCEFYYMIEINYLKTSAVGSCIKLLIEKKCQANLVFNVFAGWLKMDLYSSLDHNYCQFSDESEEFYIATPITSTLPQLASDEDGTPKNKKV